MDTGAASHVIPKTLLSQREAGTQRRATENCCSEWDTEFKDLEMRQYHPRRIKNSVEASNSSSVNVVKPFISMKKVVQASNVVVWDEGNPEVPKQTSWHDNQAGSEQWCVHDGHVGLPR